VARIGSSQLGVAHRDLVHSLAFSPDGNLLASGGYREVKIWRRPKDVQKFNLSSIARQSVLAVAVSQESGWPPAATTAASGCGIPPRAKRSGNFPVTSAR